MMLLVVVPILCPGGLSNLIMSKCRVAPVKKFTIPKMELSAVLMSARLARYLVCAYDKELSVTKITFWVDSTIALSWVKSETMNKNLFARNRVTEIHSIVTKLSNLGCVCEFKYISTCNNPADMLTRANPSLELHTLDIWWHGPAFIFDDSITVSEELIDIFINVFFLRGPEGSAVTSSNMLKVASAGDDLLSTSLPEIHRFSDFQKLMRVTSSVLRFISKCRKISRFSGCIKIPELVNAENLWLKSVQSAYYKDVVSYFVNKGVKQEKIPFLVKQLRLVFVDGFIRINTRLANSDLDFNIKCPILLPPQSHFVTLLIMHTHLRNKHDSAANVVISLRQMYWITKCRQTVKKIIHSCLTCKRFAANRYSIPRTPALPDIRVNESRPFQFTGVDLTGFIRVKAHSGVIKIYIVLFTCCVSRAVHLEIVDSVSAESFAFAFRRFISRRGLPQIMLSDNATNFIGHETLLKKLYEMAYNSDLFNSFKVEWKFIPPRSPHVGGMWERLIGMMKTLLKKSLGRSMVSLDEFSTILIEIEGRMNDRPLTYVDAESLDIISPSSLMFGHRLDSLPYNLDYDNLYDEQEGSLPTKINVC